MMDTTDRQVTILLLEDSDFDAELISEHVRQVSPEPDILRAIGRRDYVEALENGCCDVILSDYSLPGFDGMAALDLAIEKAPNTPFIFVSGVLGEEIAIESFKKGATDYVLKQRLMRLPAAIDRALAEAREKVERRRAEEQLKLLVAELSHRVKNTLATVMSIVRRSASRSSTVEDYQQTLTSRLRALSDAHALLFESNWGETDLRQVLKRTLHPFRPGQGVHIGISGPDVVLEPKAALALSLIFHELVTNAMKYGALSTDSGKVEIEWKKSPDVDAGQQIQFTWRETGGPLVEPSEPGFGHTLIARSAEYELDGEARIGFRPTGLVCEIQFAAA